MTDEIKEGSQVAQTKKKMVMDTHGHSYELTGKLGHGGQGIVCTTTYPNVLVKFSTHEDPVQRIEWLKHIRWIMRQPLQGLAIARPVAYIEHPRSGYVMELMDGLVPLSDLLEETENSMIIGQTPEERLAGFLATGGLKRRISLLARLARLLADLHGRGLAFGDLAPSNIFVSRSKEHAEVWLIDCDNLCVCSRASKQLVFTPDYGAPELMRKESGVNTLTDSWSFGVIAFRLLTLAHPLKGDLVSDGPPELEEMALLGELPWIDDPKNRQNELSTALPRDIVLTERLRSLFDQCFGEGLRDPGARPSLSSWAAGFEAAAHQTVTCEAPGCGNSFLAEKGLRCAFCDHPQPSDRHLRLSHFLFAPELGGLEMGTESDVWISTDDHIVISQNEPLELKRSPVGTSLYAASESVCKIELSPEGILFSPCSGEDVSLQVPDGTILPITTTRRLANAKRSSQRYVLHLGTIQSGHPAWSFKW